MPKMKREVAVYYDKNFEKYTKESLLEAIDNYLEFSSAVDFADSEAAGAAGLSIGSYSAPSGTFFVNNAIRYAISNSYSHYIKGACGKCAKKVREMLEAGGINTNGHPVSAYQYAGFLPKIGFRHIATLKTKSEQASWTSSNARPGDIAVMAHGEHGHICMWCGRQWISDFKQNSMWVYSGDGTCAIFRFGNF